MKFIQRITPLFSWSILLSLLFFFPACNTPKGKRGEEKVEEAQTDVRKRVVGYVAGYRDFNFEEIAAEKLTHVNYAFANIVDGKVAFDTKPIDGKVLNTEDVLKMQQLKKRNPELQILVSVGGWTWSGGFSDAALTAESRARLAKSSAEFVEANKLDGIDFDWEYPNQVGAGNVHRVEDIENFTLLMKACREELDKLTERTGKAYLLTIATGANDAYIKNTRLKEVQQYLDFINIMTYDFYTGAYNQTGHHANLYAYGHKDPRMSSVEKAVRIHLEAGVPKDKLNVGIPFYGRMWKGVALKGDTPLFAEARTAAEIVYYRTLKDDYLNNKDFKHLWDDEAQVPYLFNVKDSIFVSYENAKSIGIKVDYIKSQDLSGIMFWEYSDDSEQDLLNAIGL